MDNDNSETILAIKIEVLNALEQTTSLDEINNDPLPGATPGYESDYKLGMMSAAYERLQRSMIKVGRLVATIDD